MSIQKITQKSGVRYRARIRTSRGKQVTKTFRRKVDAKAWECEQLRLRERPDLRPDPVEDLTLGKLVNDWLSARKPHLAYSTWDGYESAMRLRVLEWFPADQLICDLAISDWDDWWDDTRDLDLSVSTLNQTLVALGTMFRWGKKRYHLTINPRDYLDALQKVDQPFDYLSAGEVNAYLSAAQSAPLYALLATALNTGMRKGELIGLRWDAVSFERCQISVRRSWCGHSFQLKEHTKNRKHRVIPMSATVSALLAEQKLMAGSSEWVFPAPMGGVTYAQTLHRQHRETCEAAGLRKIRVHDLRHTYASHFMMNGGDLFQLQKLLGHSDIKVTQRYAHLSPEYLQNAAGIVDFAGPGQPADVLSIFSGG